MRRLDLQQSTIRTFGDSAVAHSRVRMSGTSQGTPFDSKLLIMHVWVKQDGSWRLVAHQTTKPDDL
ncbi:MAG: nuclear transport factor 2 family protein [Planctomycetaceae bacterium]